MKDSYQSQVLPGLSYAVQNEKGESLTLSEGKILGDPSEIGSRIHVHLRITSAKAMLAGRFYVATIDRFGRYRNTLHISSQTFDFSLDALVKDYQLIEDVGISVIFLNHEGGVTEVTIAVVDARDGSFLLVDQIVKQCRCLRQESGPIGIPGYFQGDEGFLELIRYFYSEGGPGHMFGRNILTAAQKKERGTFSVGAQPLAPNTGRVLAYSEYTKFGLMRSWKGEYALICPDSLDRSIPPQPYYLRTQRRLSYTALKECHLRYRHPTLPSYLFAEGVMVISESS
jgi:hypothetical protein